MFHAVLVLASAMHYLWAQDPTQDLASELCSFDAGNGVTDDAWDDAQLRDVLEYLKIKRRECGLNGLLK